MTGSEPSAYPHAPTPGSPERAAVEEQVAAFLREAAEEMPAATTDVAPKPLPRTEAAFRAAICDTFVVEDLEADPASEDVRAILAQTELVMVGGRHRLRLTDDVRGRFLAAVRDLPAFRRVLSTLHAVDTRDFDAITNDPVQLPSAWLRCFLVGDFGELAKAPPSELRAAVTALERLRHVDLKANVPSLAEARRLLDLAELLEPLRILIGATGGWDGLPAKDRFIGRDSERRALRSFVDVLKSEGLYESIQRAATRTFEGVSSAVTGRSAGVLVLAARGGLGKTALIAKFVLDHALAYERRFPFAYLDFDRWAIQPRDPRLLLVEVAGQVALQYPSLDPRLSDLRRRLRAMIVDPRAQRVEDPFGEFRDVVRGMIADTGLPFLLVLDTMEVVQYDPYALKGVTAFVDALFADQFPELRVVAAGRADLPELRQATDTRAEGKLLPLEPLPVKDAERMADRLGQDLLGECWRPAWAKRIAGAGQHPPDRREPLSIRVAVEMLCSARDTAERETLAAEIEEAGEDARHEFVAILYEKRILHHVRDPDVRALAWPGLILRRVTREIVRDLLAEHCKLTPERADTAFEGLAREAWIVERRGDALHHHPDLRARTLPLMRRHNPELFHQVNDAAIRYFGARQERSQADRAEWLYHRLLGGEGPEPLERYWSAEMGALLAGADADLPRDSAAAVFLAALTARTLLPAAYVAKLPPRLALEHVARTAPELGRFHDPKLQDVLLELRPDLALESPLPPPAMAAAVTLAAKTGRWRAIRPMHHGSSAWGMHLDYALRFYRARMFEPVLVVEPPGSLPWSISPSHNAFHLLVQDLAYARLLGMPSFGQIDERLKRILETKSPQSFRPSKAMLRLVIGFGERALVPALRHLLQHLDTRMRNQLPLTLSLAEMNALSDLQEGRSLSRLALLLEEANLPRTLAEARQDGRPLRLQNDMVRPMLSEILTRMADGLRRRDETAIRRFALARDEDWLVPIAYAAARATGRRIPSAVHDRLAAQDAAGRTWSIGSVLRRSPTIRGDILQLLLRADEASDLPGTAWLFLEKAGADGDDLHTLLEMHARWRARLAEV